MNSFNCAGRLVENPKIFVDKNGVSRATFTLAVDKEYSRKHNVGSANYFDFVAWENVATYIMKKFKKGDMMVVIDAEAQSRDITDSKGNKKHKVEFAVKKVYRSHKRRTFAEYNSDFESLNYSVDYSEESTN